jgi:hypothetical protein
MFHGLIASHVSALALPQIRILHVKLLQLLCIFNFLIFSLLKLSSRLAADQERKKHCPAKAKQEDGVA